MWWTCVRCATEPGFAHFPPASSTSCCLSFGGTLVRSLATRDGVAGTGLPVHDGVQTWCGHSRLSTTEKYLHHRGGADAAEKAAKAFAPEPIEQPANDDLLEALRNASREQLAEAFQVL